MHNEHVNESSKFDYTDPYFKNGYYIKSELFFIYFEGNRLTEYEAIRLIIKKYNSGILTEQEVECFKYLVEFKHRELSDSYFPLMEQYFDYGDLSHFE